MILTGKAKEEFLKFNQQPEVWLDLMIKSKSYTALYALIIEWFDSVGYTIDRDSYNRKMIITDWVSGNEERTVIDCDYLEPFLEWLEQAILKSNETYNEKNS